MKKFNNYILNKIKHLINYKVVYCNSIINHNVEHQHYY